MFGLFKKKEKPEEAQAIELYRQVITQARKPVYYQDFNVPDDVDGRFEMLSLHEILLLLRLEQLGPDAADLSQELFDQMFHDMDRSLREMGISDLSVPKHMKRMLNGFNGRTQAYKEALSVQDSEKLLSTIERNIYGTKQEADIAQDTQKMADYIEKQWAHVSELTLDDFQKPQNIFIEEV